MSTALEHLRRLRQQAGHPTPVASPPAVRAPATDMATSLRRMLGVRTRSAPPSRAAAHQRILPGEEIADGLHLIERILPWPVIPESFDGAFAREDLLSASQLLFFDTETTGLAGGTGTRAFMIGASDFVPEGLRVRQLLIAHLAAERAMLDTFAGWLRPDMRLVSYNGRCYDAPLLITATGWRVVAIRWKGWPTWTCCIPPVGAIVASGKTAASPPSSGARWRSCERMTCQVRKRPRPGWVICVAARPNCCIGWLHTTSRTSSRWPACSRTCLPPGRWKGVRCPESRQKFDEFRFRCRLSAAVV